MFLVVGSIGLDRIWHLDRPFRVGGRHRCLRIEERLGGAGANASRVLAALGREVRLAADVATDSVAEALLAELAAAGVDTGPVARRAGETVPGEIFLGSDGERTLVSKPGRARNGPPWPNEGCFEGIYVNGDRPTPPEARRLLGPAATLIAQAPLDAGTDIPGAFRADLLVMSAADTGGAGLPALWARALHLSGGSARALIVTDGPNPIRIVKTETVMEVPPGPALPSGVDTIGAGDSFAAILLAALADGQPLIEACGRAAHATRKWLLERAKLSSQGDSAAAARSALISS